MKIGDKVRPTKTACKYWPELLTEEKIYIVQNNSMVFIGIIDDRGYRSYDKRFFNVIKRKRIILLP